jgi:phosphatidylserine/phosphatidylglycerophosphate/cardiolipin synthase-like enzyme
MQGRIGEHPAGGNGLMRFALHFGGPDLPARRLRNLLAERVEAVPAGGRILFVTYYFRDRDLAGRLLAARRRGVDVRVVVDGHPRTPRANRAVAELLRGPEGLGSGFREARCRADGSQLGKLLRPRVHEKLYVFSHPEPAAFVGSFNPSGDEPEEAPDVLAEILDQDRGHNLLLELLEPEVVAALAAHAERLHDERSGALCRFSNGAGRTLRFEDLELHFRPRLRGDPLLELLAGLGAGARVRLCSSHLSGPTATRALRSLLRRGAELEILAEASARRVPPETERALLRAGARLRRVAHPAGLPMHHKFLLVEAPGRRLAVLGSFNWTEPSLRLNREIGLVTSDPRLFDALALRWEELDAMARTGAGRAA